MHSASVSPLDQFEDEGQHPIGFLEPIDVPNMWVIQRRENLGLLLKAGE